MAKELKVIVTADTKNLESKLTKSRKVIADFGKETSKGTAAAQGFGKGILQGTTGLGGLTAGAAAAGVAVAALAVSFGKAAYAAYNQYNDTLDRISYSTANVAKVQEGFMTANLMNAASLEQNATAASVVWGRLGREVSDSTKTLVARLGKLQEESGLTGAALQNMATITQRFGMTGQVGQAFGYIISAAKDTAFSIDEISASMVSAAPLAKHLGYTMSEFAYITQKLGKNGIGVSEWASIMERQLVKFGYDTQAAKADWMALVDSINDPDYKGNKLSLLEAYGFQGGKALDMLTAIKSGAFGGGKLASSELPSLKPGDLEEYLGTKWKSISDKMYDIVNGIWQWFQPGGAGVTPNIPTPTPMPSIEIQQTDMFQEWYDSLSESDKRKANMNLLPNMPTTMEQLKKLMDTPGPQGSIGTNIPRPLAIGAMGGIAYDYKDPLVQMTTDIDQATWKMVGNADVVQANWRAAFAGTARSADYNFGSIKGTAGEAAISMNNGIERTIYSISTAFGVLNVDITDVQKSLSEWGISAPTLFDNILKGAERVGYELLNKLGLDVTKEKVNSFISDMMGSLQKYGVNLQSFWIDLTDGVKSSTETITKSALGNLKTLVGNIVMTVSDMFATGKWDWSKLWTQIWQGLLSIAVDYALKIIANETLMMSAIQAIEAFIAGLSGNWIKVALIGAGVAAAIGVTAGIIAAIKNSRENQLEATPSGLNTFSPSSIGGTSSTVIIQNPTFVGSVDDRSAQAIGEGMAQAQSIRGVTPLAFA